MAWRDASINRPNGTADGQAVSHARQTTHVSMISTNESLGAAPASTARMAAIRPRGERASSPVTR
jgi:hypothetical protein